MKKFLLFAGHNYYPNGGFDDLHGSFDSVREAKVWFGKNPKKISNSYIDHWCHVVDKDTLEIVGRFKQGYEGNDLSAPAGVVEIAKNDF